MREDLEIENFGEEAAYCSVEIVVDADFADLFEVKEGRVHKQGKLGCTTTAAGASRSPTSGARSPGRRTSTSPGEPRISGSHVHYEVIVPPRGRWSACMQVTPVIGEMEITPRYLCGQPVERSTPSERLEEWKRRLPLVSTDDERFGACSTGRRRTSPGCASSIPSSPIGRSSPRARRGS